MCVCVYVCVCVCLCMRACIHIYIYIYMHIGKHNCTILVHLFEIQLYNIHEDIFFSDQQRPRAKNLCHQDIRTANQRQFNNIP